MKYFGPLQVIFFLSSIIFILFAIDWFKRKKLNILHFLVFFWWSLMVAIFARDIKLLNLFWSYFWLQRWADLLVYMAIIILIYLYFWLINKIIKINIQQTEILRQISINEALWSINKNINIVLIMPCYKNHADINHIKAILDNWYWIVFIDDWFNSNELIEKIKELINWDKDIVLIRHPQNLGQWAALQTGQRYIIKYNSAPYVMHFDSDGQHDIKDIPTFLSEFKKNPELDIVIGSRFLWKRSKIPFRRIINKKLQIFFTKIVIWLPLTDTHNWLRMMKHETLHKLTITLNDYTHASEIEYLIKQESLKRKEVPMHVIYEDHHIAWWQPLSNAINIAKKIIYRLLFFR